MVHFPTTYVILFLIILPSGLIFAQKKNRHCFGIYKTKALLLGSRLAHPEFSHQGASSHHNYGFNLRNYTKTDIFNGRIPRFSKPPNLISWFLTNIRAKHIWCTGRWPDFPWIYQVNKSSRSLAQTRLRELKASVERKELRGDERFRMIRNG